MGHTCKNESHFEKGDTLGKRGYHLEYTGSHFEKWIILGKMNDTLPKWVTLGKKGHTC